MLIIHPIVQSGVGIVALEEAAKSLQCTWSNPILGHGINLLVTTVCVCSGGYSVIVLLPVHNCDGTEPEDNKETYLFSSLAYYAINYSILGQQMWLRCKERDKERSVTGTDLWA